MNRGKSNTSVFGALVLALALSWAAGPAQASVAEGLAAYRAGDYAVAVRELRPAADSGDREAQFVLGQLHERGRGVSQDFVAAHKWYNLAASLGHADAAAARDALARRMTAGQVAEAQAAASSWRPSGATEAQAASGAESAAPPTAPPYSLRNTQALLNELGYDAGPSDGIMGSRTRSAIRRFQIERGLPVDGEATPSLYRELLEARSPRATRHASPATPEPPTTSVLVADIQAELRRRGYPVSLVDGRLDDKTRAAIRSYQADAGLPMTGQPSQKLLADLRRQDETMAISPPDREQVTAVQQALAARGYDPGPADGVLGPKARDAIRAYERDSGLPQSGRITEPLLERLGLAGAAAGPSAAWAPPSAAVPQWRGVLFDDFSDGDYTRSPPWTVSSGSFFVRQGTLVSRVPLPPSGAQTAEDLGRALIRDVLTQALSGPQGVASEARISTAAAIGDAFRLEVDIASDAPGGSFAFGPFQDDPATDGYRLVYSGGAAPRLELVAVSQSGVRTLYSIEVEALDDGKLHRITWEREGDGIMRVSLDGQPTMTLVDRAFGGSFSGFTLLNRGGTIGLGRIRIETRA